MFLLSTALLLGLPRRKATLRANSMAAAQAGNLARYINAKLKSGGYKPDVDENDLVGSLKAPATR